MGLRSQPRALSATRQFGACRVGGGGKRGRVGKPWEYHVKTGTEDLGPIQEGDGEILSSQVPSALRRTSHSA